VPKSPSLVVAFSNSFSPSAEIATELGPKEAEALVPGSMWENRPSDYNEVGPDYFVTMGIPLVTVVGAFVQRTGAQLRRFYGGFTKLRFYLAPCCRNENLLTKLRCRCEFFSSRVRNRIAKN
jgi:hypothetical protein